MGMWVKLEIQTEIELHGSAVCACVLGQRIVPVQCSPSHGLWRSWRSRPCPWSCAQSEGRFAVAALCPRPQAALHTAAMVTA